MLEALAADYAAWWIDFLGEHNHIGGEDSTRWLLERARLRPGSRMLDCGAFVGASARTAALRYEAAAFATDMNHDFLAAGRQMEGGERVRWITAMTQRLPFADGSFASVWSLDSDIAPAEMTRVAAAQATICLCCEVPDDSRGGLDAFLDEWRALGWQLAAHRPLSSEATQTWRRAEAELVRRRPVYEPRYGTRGYLAQLDLVAHLVQAYERGLMGHGLFVLARG